MEKFVFKFVISMFPENCIEEDSSSASSMYEIGYFPTAKIRITVKLLKSKTYSSNVLKHWGRIWALAK